MKRALIQNVKVYADAAGKAIDRMGLLSAVVGVSVATAAAGNTLTLKVLHCDTETGTFEPVPDTMLSLGEKIEDVPVTAGTDINFDIDLLGCKQFVMFSLTTAATVKAAVVLGDPAVAPPM